MISGMIIWNDKKMVILFFFHLGKTRKIQFDSVLLVVDSHLQFSFFFQPHIYIV